MKRESDYKPTEEHKHKIRLSKLGAKNARWKGNDAAKASANERARRLYKNIGPCSVCGNPKSERHHADGNPYNNEIDNIMILCRKHHMEVDGRMSNLIGANHKRSIWHPRKRPPSRKLGRRESRLNYYRRLNKLTVK